LTEDVQRLELRQDELRQTLAQLRHIARSEAEKIARQKAELTTLEQSLSQKDVRMVQKKEQLDALKKDISTRPVA
jgi:DNA-binding SARP family transcriptional activator